MDTFQKWAAFGFFGCALVAGAFAKVNFHDHASILSAIVVAGTGLGGLCLHPPWLPGAQPAPPPQP